MRTSFRDFVKTGKGKLTVALCALGLSWIFLLWNFSGSFGELLPGEEQVDLAQYIYESIVLSLPYQRVHPEGECNPEMLERFRIVSDREFSAIEAQAAARGHNDGEWAKLAALREQMVAETSQAADAADPEREKQ